MIKSSRYYPFPLWIFIISHHRKGLSRSGLPISEDGPVKALKRILDERIPASLIDVVLFGINAVYVIKDEVLDIVTFLDA